MSTHDDELFTQLFDARALVNRREKALADAKARLDALVATTVSGEPTSPAWYDTPGKLSRDRVMEAAGLTTMQLHRAMERYRTAYQPTRPRRRRKAAR
jgi:hypothetical protein